ncbi:hypothetical protein NPX13_g11131 [Xylaria arbuscula]|uniref:Uncharacterized protein n=1 Tax=Xylaria arbuscula TaxID=114810 RepID=A0A9W8N3Q8_9PEZI|nr:hypothetical protein NPX13_g11131 [Xylaria arbuscula]
MAGSADLPTSVAGLAASSVLDTSVAAGASTAGVAAVVAAAVAAPAAEASLSQHRSQSYDRSRYRGLDLLAGASALAASVAPEDSPALGFLSFFLKAALSLAFRLVSAFGAV